MSVMQAGRRGPPRAALTANGEGTHLMNVRKRVALLAATAVLGSGFGLSAASSASAHSAPSLQSGWKVYKHAGDVAGADARGSISQHGNGRVYLTGTLKDTKHDGEYALLQISAKYADKGKRYEYDVTGSHKELGSQGGYNFAESVRTIEVQECLAHKAGNKWHLDKCGKGWYTIWSS